MSALSVMSLIAPTAPVGASAAPVETAADEGLFAGLVAAVVAPLKAQGEDSAPALDAPVAEDAAAETPALDAAVAAAPAWPPLPLIAPAPLPVAPFAPAAASEDAAPAGTAAPTPPVAPVPPLDVATPATGAPALSADKAPADDALVAVAAPLTDAPDMVSDMGKTPVTAASPRSEPAPTEARPAQPMPAASQRPAVAAETRPSVAAETPPAAVVPVQGPAQAEQAMRQSAVAPRPAPPQAPAAPASTEAAPAAVDGATESRAENAATPRAAIQTPVPVTMTASSALAAPTASAQAAPEAPATPTVAPTTQPVEPTAPVVAVAAAPVAPTPRPAAAAAPQPVKSAPLTPQTVQPAPPVEAGDIAEPIIASAAAETEADGEAAPQTPPPATATPTPAPARNSSARLDERRSNAATASAPADARSDAASGARSVLPTSTLSAAAPASSAALLSDAAPAPVLPADAAPLDVQVNAAPAQHLLDAQSAAPTAQRDLGLSQLSRATVETTAQLAAQMIKKLEGRSTRFDMALTPEGLGRVDVSLEIDSDGRLAARLAFDNPAAATDMRARADELRRQLQDAGFQLTQDSLQFSDRNPSSGFGGGAFDRAPDRRAFAGAARLAAQADAVVPTPGPWTSLSMTPDRVDMKV